MTGNKKKKRAEARQKRQTQKRLQASLVIGSLLVVAAFFAFSGRSKTPADDLSAEELESLPVAPAVGSRAPDFTLNNPQGQPVSLSDYRGRPVAMMFFHTW